MDNVERLDTLIKVNTYLEEYESVLSLLYIMDKAQFAAEIKAASERANNNVPNADVEMLAMLKVGYKYAIKDGKEVSDFTARLAKYKNMNKELYKELLY
jgi:hypothetical protein